MYVDTTSDCTLANFVKTYLILQQYLTGRAYNLQNFLKKKKKKLIIKKTKLFQTLKQNSIHELHTIIPHFIREKLNVLKILWKSKAKDTFHEISKKQNNQKSTIQFHAISYSYQGEKLDAVGRCKQVPKPISAPRTPLTRSPRSHGSP